ncbi:hypothetical protein AB0O22_38830 [Streptomyces sp. NPDC091204]|uniref:hypothetical protein n=1 Tax=Streptomyces sp. NPDC091204 TaxID=3155299 RepID=UPI003445FC3D
MLDAALVALAESGGSAVVQAAGTDAWNGLRSGVARLLGRGDEGREQAELARLDQTATALLELELEPAAAERVQLRQEASWQARFEALLESVGDEERVRLAEGLRALVAEQPARAGGDGGAVFFSNTFHGATALQVGNSNRQDNRFGTGS